MRPPPVRRNLKVEEVIVLEGNMERVPKPLFLQQDQTDPSEGRNMGWGVSGAA